MIINGIKLEMEIMRLQNKLDRMNARMIINRMESELILEKLQVEIMRLQHKLDWMKACKMDSIKSKPTTNTFRDEINQIQLFC